MEPCAGKLEADRKKHRGGREKMKHGFVKVAAATPDIRVADVEFNTEKIFEGIDKACENKAVSYTHLTLPTTSRV